MVEMTAIIQNSQGIHCRPSAVIVKETMVYPGRCYAIVEEKECDIRSVMGLLILGLQKGTQLTVRVEGPNEEAFCRKLVQLFETKFDFPPRESSEG